MQYLVRYCAIYCTIQNNTALSASCCKFQFGFFFSMQLTAMDTGNICDFFENFPTDGVLQQMNLTDFEL